DLHVAVVVACFGVQQKAAVETDRALVAGIATQGYITAGQRCWRARWMQRRTPQSRHQAAVESTAAELQSFTVPGGWQVYFEIDVGRRVGSRMNCAKHLAEAAILVVGGIGGDKLRGPDRCPA